MNHFENQNFSEKIEIIDKSSDKKLDDKKNAIINYFLSLQIEHEGERISFNLQEAKKMQQGISNFKFETIVDITPDRFVQNAKNFQISLADWKKACLLRSRLISQLPETLYDNIVQSAQKLGIDKKVYIAAALDNPLLFSQNPKKIASNIDKISEKLPINKSVIIKAALYSPQIFSSDPYTLIDYVNQNAKALNISPKKYIQAALVHPSLFLQKPERTLRNIKGVAQGLSIDFQTYAAAALQRPSLLYRPADKILNNVFGIIEKFNPDLDQKKYIEAALSFPQLFYQLPQTIYDNIVGVTEQLDIERKIYIQAALTAPSLFCQSPDTVVKKINRTAKNLGIDLKTYIQIALSQPRLFGQKSETVTGNIHNVADHFLIDRMDYLKIALKRTQLFYQKPDTIINNIETATQLMDIEISKYLEAAMRYPTLFTQSPHSNAAKYQLLVDYYPFPEEVKEKILKHPAVLTTAPEKIAVWYIISKLRGQKYLQMSKLTKNPASYAVKLLGDDLGGKVLEIYNYLKSISKKRRKIKCQISGKEAEGKAIRSISRLVFKYFGPPNQPFDQTKFDYLYFFVDQKDKARETNDPFYQKNLRLLTKIKYSSLGQIHQNILNKIWHDLINQKNTLSQSEIMQIIQSRIPNQAQFTHGDIGNITKSDPRTFKNAIKQKYQITSPSIPSSIVQQEYLDYCLNIPMCQIATFVKKIDPDQFSRKYIKALLDGKQQLKHNLYGIYTVTIEDTIALLQTLKQKTDIKKTWVTIEDFAKERKMSIGIAQKWVRYKIIDQSKIIMFDPYYYIDPTEVANLRNQLTPTETATILNIEKTFIKSGIKNNYIKHKIYFHPNKPNSQRIILIEQTEIDRLRNDPDFCRLSKNFSLQQTADHFQVEYETISNASYLKHIQTENFFGVPSVTPAEITRIENDKIFVKNKPAESEKLSNNHLDITKTAQILGLDSAFLDQLIKDKKLPLNPVHYDSQTYFSQDEILHIISHKAQLLPEKYKADCQQISEIINIFQTQKDYDLSSENIIQLVALSKSNSPLSEDAKNILWLKYKKLISSLARNKFTLSLSQEELINEGGIGLMRAIRNFNLGHDNGFTSYAYQHIDGAIKSAIETQDRLQRLPSHVIPMFRYIHRLKKELQEKLDRDPSWSEIASEIKLDENHQSIFKTKQNIDIEFIKSIYQGGNLPLPLDQSHQDNENYQPLLDQISLSQSESQTDEYAEIDNQILLKNLLSIPELNAPEKQILLYDLIFDASTENGIKEISTKMEIPPSEVITLREQAFAKIKTSKIGQDLNNNK